MPGWKRSQRFQATDRAIEKQMAHITLPEGFPGIRGLMKFRPETANPLNELVQVLLRGPGTLTGRARVDCDLLRFGAERLHVLSDNPRRHRGTSPRRQ